MLKNLNLHSFLRKSRFIKQKYIPKNTSSLIFNTEQLRSNLYDNFLVNNCYRQTFPDRVCRNFTTENYVKTNEKSMKFEEFCEKYEEIKNENFRNKKIELIKNLFLDLVKNYPKTGIYHIFIICMMLTGHTAPTLKQKDINLIETRLHKTFSDYTKKLSEDSESIEFQNTTNNKDTIHIEDIYELFCKLKKIEGTGSDNIKQFEILRFLYKSGIKDENHLDIQKKVFLKRVKIGVNLVSIEKVFITLYNDLHINEDQFKFMSNEFFGYVQSNTVKSGTEFNLEIGMPVRSMQAKPINSSIEAYNQFVKSKVQGVFVETKLDGERIQVHWDSVNEILSLYSRSTDNVDSKYLNLKTLLQLILRKSDVKSFILDGEIVAYDYAISKVLSFHFLQQRARKYGTDNLDMVTVKIFLFDCLMSNHVNRISQGLGERKQALKEVLESYKQVEIKEADFYTSVLRPDYVSSYDDITEDHQINQEKTKKNSKNAETLFQECDNKFIELTEDSENFSREVDDLLKTSKNEKQEGLMIKAGDSNYIPGNRNYWYKYKSKFEEGIHETLDLVVLGVYNGKGKRDKVFGSFLLGSYDPKKNVYQPISKVGSGFTDNDLEELTNLLKPAINRTGIPFEYNYCTALKPDFWVKPTVVVECNYNDMTSSPIYNIGKRTVYDTKGISLRFPIFKRIRDDKTPLDCTTTETIIELYLRVKKPADKL